MSGRNLGKLITVKTSMWYMSVYIVWPIAAIGNTNNIYIIYIGT